MPTPALRPFVLLLAITLLGAGVPNLLSAVAVAADGPDHLVVSELVTGGTSASDEFIELYNPTAAPLPLEGLELVYASASGLTVSRRAAWELGAPEVPPGGHVLVANELGIYATIADATYASGMAATGGSVALRIVGATSAIDAVGWGTAASIWLEGSVAPAPPVGSSLERLPGGALGSTRDTDDNAADFVVRDLPGPENSASPTVPEPPTGSPTATPAPSLPTTPAPTPAPTPSLEPTPTVSASGEPTAVPTPGTEAVPIAVARELPDGTAVTVEGVALTGSEFADGGGYLADESGGLAVLLADGSFARGDRLRVSGTIDDRYAQRTLRATAADVAVLGPGADPAPLAVATGAVSEDMEGRLVRIGGSVLSAPTTLSAGLAFEVDDGSGPVRLLIGSTTDIDAGTWAAGFVIDAIGVVGQRDSSGTGAAGYRVQPRDAADVLAAAPGTGPSPTASPGATATPEPSPPEPSPPADLVSVATARGLPKGASATVRGVVTLAPGLVDPTTAVLQDATGAIVLRVSDEAGPVVRGTRLEVAGVRSTLAGMETLRVSAPPRSLGSAAEPAPRPLATGSAGEQHEATLVVVRGGIVATPRRSSAGSVSFEIDDGSGPLRVSIGASAGIDASALAAGSWIEVRGVLGQETTGSLPLRGYRAWPRDAADLRVVAPATPAGTAASPTSADADGGASGSSVQSLGSLEALGGADVSGLPVGATLVLGPWAELGIGGLLWDGTRLVALHEDVAPLVRTTLNGGRAPVAVRATGLRVIEQEGTTGLPVATVPDVPGAFVPSGLSPAPPLAGRDLDGDQARWASLVGRLDPRSEPPALVVPGARLPISLHCDNEPMPDAATVGITGVLVGEPPRLVVPCGGVVPAPRLAGAPALPVAATGDQSRTATMATVPDGPPAMLPAALLVLAATTLAIGVGVARWAARTPPPGPEADAVEPEAASEEVPARTLTLVPLPHERAP